MPTEFLVPSLRIQVEHRLNEKQSEQARAEGLLRLEEERLNSLNMLEHEQLVRKAFVDWHRCFNEDKFSGREAGVGVPDTVRSDAREAQAKVGWTILDCWGQRRHLRAGNPERREVGPTCNRLPDEALLR